MGDQLAAYGRLVAARIRSDWQYRASFALLLAAQALVSLLDLVVVVVLFHRVEALAGWSATEVALLFGLGGTAFGLADLTAGTVEHAAAHIRAGSFDQFLLRPVGPLIQLSASEFALRRLGRVLPPAAVLVVALSRAEVDWTPARATLVPVALASGTVAFSAIWVVTASAAFWTVQTQEVANSFTYGGSQLVRYPLDVLGSWLRRLATFVVPLAFVAYLPAAALLGRRPVSGGPAWLAWLAPAVSAGLALVARAVWRSAVAHYRSTGS